MGSKFKMGNWEIVEIQRNSGQDESFRYVNAANQIKYDEGSEEGLTDRLGIKNR